MLEHKNGWHRRTAARLLFERLQMDSKNLIVDLLRQNVLASAHAEARIRMMYLLANAGMLKDSEVVSLLQSDHPYIRIHALRMAESRMNHELSEHILSMVSDMDTRVGFQLALTLGECKLDSSDAIAALAESKGSAGSPCPAHAGG